MDLDLTQSDLAFLSGENGPGARMAMSIIVRMAEASGAARLMDISAAHIDSALYMGEATLEFAERLADLGARVVVPTSLNVSGVDEFGWHQWATPEVWAQQARRQMSAYVRMGCTPTWTCAPYQTSYRPIFGQQIAWGESNAIAFANSVIGARTERYPDLLDICAAITGRVPASGLHLDENRCGQLLFRLVNIPYEIQSSEVFFPVMGHILGKLSGDRIPVVQGIQTTPSEDQLKALGAAAASAGGIALFHLVGITPEAPTVETAFQGRNPEKILEITIPILREAYRELTNATEDRLDLVALGCPHFSLVEMKQLADLVTGKHVHPEVTFLITTNRLTREKARQAGFLERIEQFGARITVDTCILTTPMLPQSIKVILTNSGKYAYYTPGLLNRQVYFRSLTECVHSAIEGRLVREDPQWTK